MTGKSSMSVGGLRIQASLHHKHRRTDRGEDGTEHTGNECEGTASLGVGVGGLIEVDAWELGGGGGVLLLNLPGTNHHGLADGGDAVDYDEEVGGTGNHDGDVRGEHGSVDRRSPVLVAVGAVELKVLLSKVLEGVEIRWTLP